MPIDIVKHALHIRRKKNAQVFRNIARLWDIGRQSQSEQALLDGLHPWREPHHLRFFNTLPYLLIIIAVNTLIFGYFLHPHIQLLWSISAAIFIGFLAYLLYESPSQLTEVIHFLEQRIIQLRYNLNFQQLPAYLPIHAQPTLVLSKLKQNFPIFQRGSESNEISQYASTVWDDSHTQHQVLIFQYHYVDKVVIANTESKQITKSIHKDLWGAFIFQIPTLGIAVSNQRSRFFTPYVQSWQSSDIQTNQSLHILGQNQHQLAKVMSPSMTLKLNDFFQHFQGDLIYHHQENMLCYLGEQDLFTRISKHKDIHDIPALRGHLRMLNMPEYQKFKTLMLNLIE